MLIEAPGFCEKHKREKQRQQDERRGTAAERGYDGRWVKARATWLRKYPLCVHCERESRVTAATVVDHIKPHKLKQAIDSGDSEAIRRAQELFWDSENNWMSLCKYHHDLKTATEDGGFGRRPAGPKG